MNLHLLVGEINAALRSLEADYEGLTLREKVLCLVEVLRRAKDLNVAVVRDSGCDARGARERIRLYLVAYAGVVIAASELEVVGGISEYGRRIRELRVQDGYSILSGNSSDPEAGITLRPDEYLLLRAEADRDAAHRWHIANRIRREKGSASERLLRYFVANVGSILTSEELSYVAKISEWARRTRELRTEQGYAVATRNTGRPDLMVGEYVMESATRVAEPHDRHVSLDVQQAVYARDRNRCRNCGWDHSHWTRDDPRVLELHHAEHHARGGPNTEDNLLVLCNVCHDDVHAGRIAAPTAPPR